MGTQAEDIPHLRIGDERGYGIINPDTIEVLPNSWHKWISPFPPPPESFSIEFPNINILDKNSCSACQSTLLLFLKRYGNRLFDYFSSDTKINIAIGKDQQKCRKALFVSAIAQSSTAAAEYSFRDVPRWAVRSLLPFQASPL